MLSATKLVAPIYLLLVRWMKRLSMSPFSYRWVLSRANPSLYMNASSLCGKGGGHSTKGGCCECSTYVYREMFKVVLLESGLGITQ